MRKSTIIWIIWFCLLVLNWAFVMLPNLDMNFFQYPLESLTILVGSLMWFVIPYVIWYFYEKQKRKKR